MKKLTLSESKRLKLIRDPEFDSLIEDIDPEFRRRTLHFLSMFIDITQQTISQDHNAMTPSQMEVIASSLDKLSMTQTEKDRYLQILKLMYSDDLVNKGFPSNERRVRELVVATSGVSAVKAENSGPPVESDSVRVILNGLSDFMKKDTVEKYREHGSSEYTIIIDKTNKRVWYYKNRVLLNPDSYELLCILARSCPGTPVRYEKIYYDLWGLTLAKNQIRKTMLDRIQKVVYRAIWPRQEELREHVIIDPHGLGPKITKGSTVLLLEE